MNIQINTDEIKQSLSKHHLSDLVLYVSWIFMHLGFFSKMPANDFFIFAGVINFSCALLYKFVSVVINGK